MELTYFVRHVYGRPLLYPVNEPAHVLCEIAGKKTLDQSLLFQAARLGFKTTEVRDERL